MMILIPHQVMKCIWKGIPGHMPAYATLGNQYSILKTIYPYTVMHYSVSRTGQYYFMGKPFCKLITNLKLRTLTNEVQFDIFMAIKI